MFPARGLNRDRRIPLCRAYYVFALTSWQCAMPAEWITRVVYLPQCGETTTAKRDDLHSKSSFLVKNKGQWNAKSGPKGILLCEQNFRDVWIRNKSVRTEIGQILRTHTHTHTTAAKLVVRMWFQNEGIVNSRTKCSKMSWTKTTYRCNLCRYQCILRDSYSWRSRGGSYRRHRRRCSHHHHVCIRRCLKKFNEDVNITDCVYQMSIRK